MILLLAFAFLAGIFTVLSPCILPILPAILSAGTVQGRLRPLGIIVGLVASFTFFTLALTALVQATGISPDILRYGAIALIFFFGLVMIFPRLSEGFARKTASIANLGQNLSHPSSGFGGGFIFGLALGLLWTPCAGPILAAITTLVATHAIDLLTVAMTLSYSIGAGIPMFLIAYGGNRIIQSSRFLSVHAERIRQFFGVLMVGVAVILTFHWDMLLEQKLGGWIPSALVENNTKVQEQLTKLKGESPTVERLRELGKAPDLKGITGWINSPPLSIEELKGKVVLIDFWTYSCINCLRTLPYLEDWYAKYKDVGLVIIGVHTPEFVFEKDPKNVAAAARRLGVEYPIALDNDYKTWQAYKNNYWPAHYLIDKDGNMRMEHFGEGSYVETENGIRDLLGLAPLQMEESLASSRTITPETYLGAQRGHSYKGLLKVGETATYADNPPLGDDEVGLRGDWRVEEESIESAGSESYLDLNFLARQVYLVLSGSSKKPIEVFLDGKRSGEFYMDGDKKYDIVETTYQRHQLSLKIPPGVKAYAFTFGDESH
ncbi:MAG: cytochrome c biogenesis protein DipZ [Verrucomicrobia bacterium]|nr:cytochrome c biogenesis protein DipZ [Verrucomicrobiota bacterium]